LDYLEAINEEAVCVREFTVFVCSSKVVAEVVVCVGERRTRFDDENSLKCPSRPQLSAPQQLSEVVNNVNIAV
jgi:hypothetical protein